MSMQVTTAAAAGNSVNVIDSSISTQQPYNGSVPMGVLKDGVLNLTLEDALKMGLRQNLGAITESSAIQQATGQRQVARSELMPQLNVAVSEEFERLNLRTQGVEVNTFPESVKFNFYDARTKLNQSVFDLVKIRNLRGASESLKANIKASRNARDLIVLAVSGSYLQQVSTMARIEATAAQVEVSRAIYKQAVDRLAAGLVPRVDVTRSQVQLQTEEQRLRQLQADLETQKLNLARIIGLPLGQKYKAVNEYRFESQVDFTLETALHQAFERRSDLQAANSGVKAAEFSIKAAHAERLPSLNVNADFGAAGVTPTHESTGVYSVAGTLSIPIFEGGRIHGDIEQSSSVLRQRKSEYEDLRGQIDQDVRQAFIDMNSAADQVEVAKSNVELAHETLEQSRDRFVAGVTDTVELVQAQQSVAQADEDFITAVYEHNLAKVSLARAMGDAEQTLPQLLRKQ
ncbi:TolC family protein [Acidicapsa ligni]|uniref:TolC family protein n=1 Tax=Acidicapsa ligni TaxID=542300 RepID=UPI0021E0259F|nr:TolC family protein [Acidicapsa ligni]